MVRISLRCSERLERGILARRARRHRTELRSHRVPPNSAHRVPPGLRPPVPRPPTAQAEPLPRRPTGGARGAHGADGNAPNPQARVQIGRLQQALQRECRRRGPPGRAGKSPSRKGISHFWGRVSRKVGQRMRIGLHGGRQWDTVGHACGTRVAGLLPPSHPGSSFGQANENP